MSIVITQTCTRCGSSRRLGVGRRGQASDVESASRAGGWRSLTSGSLEATFCNQCVRQLIDDARTLEQIRTDAEAGEPA